MRFLLFRTSSLLGPGAAAFRGNGVKLLQDLLLLSFFTFAMNYLL